MAFKTMEDVRAAFPKWFQKNALPAEPEYGKEIIAGRFFIVSYFVPYLPEYGPARTGRVMYPSPVTGKVEECVRRYFIYEARTNAIDRVYYFGSFSRARVAVKALMKRLAERPDLARAS